MIQKCWWRSTIFKKPVDEIQDYLNQQDQVSYTKLQAQINRLPNLANPLTVNKYIQLEGEVVKDQLDKGDKEQIFQDMVDQYRVDNEDIPKLRGEEDIEIDKDKRDIPL